MPTGIGIGIGTGIGIGLKEEEKEMSVELEHKSYARVGFLGNPSDVYFGRTISFSLANFWASVTLRPSDQLLIQPHLKHDLVSFHSIHHLVQRLDTEGYYGGVRLLMAICKVFYRHCQDNSIELKNGNFTLSYDTNIPRQTGLSGSSAIVCAALNCLMDFYNVRHLLKVEIRPNLILSAEKELGIVAGLQDRVAQVYGGLVYMDFSRENMDKLGHGIYKPMDVNLLPSLFLIYAENPSDSGKVHSTVRQRWLDGDEFIISSMKEVAELAEKGKIVLLEKNYKELANLMNRNFDLRSQLVHQKGVSTLTPDLSSIFRTLSTTKRLDTTLHALTVARSVGAAAKFTGSGGAVVAFCPDGPTQSGLLDSACKRAGFSLQKISVVPSFLSEDELKSLINC